MATLLLRLAGPMQAWGTDSKFETRRTGREPSKSGVVGLLAAALGLRRDQSDELKPLNSLRFGVRVDQEGALLTDFHTAHSDKTAYITYRHYLSDAVFVVGLESDDHAYLETLQYALNHPAFPLFLGRRSCPPTQPFCLGIRDMDLEQTLQSEPLQGRNQTVNCRILMDALPEDRDAVPCQDLPVSFSPVHRQYGYRRVRQFQSVPNKEQGTEHDPFAEL